MKGVFNMETFEIIISIIFGLFYVFGVYCFADNIISKIKSRHERLKKREDREENICLSLLRIAEHFEGFDE